MGSLNFPCDCILRRYSWSEYCERYRFSLLHKSIPIQDVTCYMQLPGKKPHQVPNEGTERGTGVDKQAGFQPVFQLVQRGRWQKATELSEIEILCCQNASELTFRAYKATLPSSINLDGPTLSCVYWDAKLRERGVMMTQAVASWVHGHYMVV